MTIRHFNGFNEASPAEGATVTAGTPTAVTVSFATGPDLVVMQPSRLEVEVGERIRKFAADGIINDLPGHVDESASRDRLMYAGALTGETGTGQTAEADPAGEPGYGALDFGGVLGRTVQHPIDRVEFLPAMRSVRHVTAVCREVTALCPVTSQPDVYVVTVDYDVHDRVIESKSLKLYLWRFRDVGISCESLAGTIAIDLAEQLDDGVHETRVEVAVEQAPRGGISLIARAEHAVGRRYE